MDFGIEWSTIGCPLKKLPSLAVPILLGQQPGQGQIGLLALGIGRNCLPEASFRFEVVPGLFGHFPQMEVRLCVLRVSSQGQGLLAISLLVTNHPEQV